MNRSEIETKLHIIRAGLECAPHTSTNAAACAALIALQEALLADQPTPTEPLVHRGTITIGPEPDGSVRQVAIVGVSQGSPPFKNCPAVSRGDWCVLPEGHAGVCDFGR